MAIASAVASPGGLFDSPEVLAAFITSILALLAAIIAAVVAGHEGRLTRSHALKLYETESSEARRREQALDQRFRDFTGREQWWREFTWAVERYHQDDERLRSSALSILMYLNNAPWVGKDEKRTIATILTPRKHSSGGAP